MPGMMDTVLNLGLNPVTVEALAKLSGNPRFAYDSYRRFIQMYANVVLGVEHGCSRRSSRPRRRAKASSSTPISMSTISSASPRSSRTR
jgi:pyruvate,orthophosphate dikinase